MRGKALKFGDNISTDLIQPGRYSYLKSNLNELAKHVLEDADPDFASRVQHGDFVVAGKNMGLGSSREHAPLIIKMAGISGILAKSVGRIFFRNAINLGLPILICNTDLIADGDQLEANMEEGRITNITSGVTIDFSPIPKVMLDILNEGGLISYIRKYGRFQNQ